MNFLDLNVDVKRLILDHLSQSDLLRICLTHPQLYQLARPILYSSIELPSGICSRQSHPITSLLRTILSQHDVARHIRRLSFVTNYKRHTNILWSPAQDDHKARKFLISPSDVEAATQFVRRCEGEVSYRDSWIEALQMATMDAYLAVLLLNLPSIDYLRIDPVLLIETEFFGRVLRSSLCDKPPSLVPPVGHPASLQVLRELSLYRRDYSPNPNTFNILPVFCLPAVKKLSIYIDDPAEELRWPTCTGSPPEAFGLQSLEVEGLHEVHLGNLLSATPTLSSLTWTREFTVQSAYYPGPLTLGPIINLHRLRTSLAVAKDTLTTLKIQTNDLSVGDRLTGRDEMDNNVVRSEGPLRSLCLAEFKQLKVLEVPSEFIMGFPLAAAASESSFSVLDVLGDNLPPNIEELKISTEASWSFWEEGDFDSSCKFPYIQGILTWLADVERHTPNIRKFSYLDYSASYYQTQDQEHLAARDKMRESAVTVGIEYSHEWYDWLGEPI